MATTNRAAIDQAFWPAPTVGDPPPSIPRRDRQNAVLTSMLGDVESLEARATVARSTALRVATFGDSTANLGGVSSPDTHAMSPYVSAPFPATGVTIVGINALAKIFVTQLYPQAHLVFNGGVSGEGVTQMLARDAAASGVLRKAITDLAAYSPDVVLMRGGSINNLVNATAANWQSTADSVFAAHVTILARVLTAAPYVVDSGVFGYGDGSAATGADPASVRLALQHLNSRMRTELPGLFGGRVVFVDPLGILQAADGRFLPGMAFDGVHLNLAGGIAHGQAEAAVLTALFGRSVGPRYRGANLVANAMMQTTGAVTGGTAATGFNISITNGTPSGVAIESVSGAPFQVATVTQTAANCQAGILMTAPIQTAGLLATDVIAAEYDYFVEGVAGWRPNVTLYGRIDITKTAAGRLINTCFEGTAFQLPAGGVRGRMVFPPMLLGEASSAISGTVFSLVVGLPDAAPGGTAIKVGVGIPRLVRVV